MEQNSYNASDIKILEGLEAVRKRPAMYIGSTDKNGLHHLVYEVLDNSVDEALAGHCTEIKVDFHQDGSVSVEDNGRGIPIGIHKDKGIPAVEVVLTVLHAGGKFEGKGYKVSGGLHGVGVSCVNALSSKLIVEVHREGKKYIQEFNKGIPAGPGKFEDSVRKHSGTKIRFWSDNSIFETDNFIFETIATRTKELAYLNKGLKFIIVDERDEEGRKEVFQFEGGIVSYVNAIDAKKDPLFKDPIYVNKEKDNVEVEVCLHYSKNYFDEHVISFVNNIRTKEGGTHLSGFRTALTRQLNIFAKKHNLFKQGEILTGNDVKEGLTAIISVKVPDPQFEGQTKGKLGNSEVKGIVDSVFAEALEGHLERTPSVGKDIINKGLLAFRAREAARKAQDLARRKNVLESTSLPGKLADCTERDAAKAELFIVEGDSAGGSAKQGRDRNFQAILPLRGKIINVEKARLDKILGNEEIKSLITAVGPEVVARIDQSEELTAEEVAAKIRYHKIVIMTDADVDGAHIRTLLLTFLYRYARQILESGMLYIAQPPLYLVKKGNRKEYVYNEDQKRKLISDLNLAGIILKRNQNPDDELTGDAILEYVEKLKNFKNLMEDADKNLYNQDIILDIIFNLDLQEFIKIKKTLNAVEIEPEFSEIEADDLEQDILEGKANVEVEEPEQQYQFTEYLLQIIQENKIDVNLLKEIKHYTDEIKEALNAPFIIIEANGNQKTIDTNTLLIKFIDGLAGKGINLQRYKGLGEMNPDQLWETTMDPNNRTLLRIKIEDAEKADEIFTVLMGSDVESRKSFIDEYARQVKWLDV